MHREDRTRVQRKRTSPVPARSRPQVSNIVVYYLLAQSVVYFIALLRQIEF